MLKNNQWQFDMWSAVHNDAETHKEEYESYSLNIFDELDDSIMNKDTCHRTGGIVRGIYNIFEPEEIELFEKLLIRK